MKDHLIWDGTEKSSEAPTYQQIADILTKPLAKGKLEAFIKKLGLVQNIFLSKRECWEILLKKELPHEFSENVLEGI